MCVKCIEQTYEAKGKRVEWREVTPPKHFADFGEGKKDITLTIEKWLKKNYGEGWKIWAVDFRIYGVYNII